MTSPRFHLERAAVHLWVLSDIETGRDLRDYCDQRIAIHDRDCMNRMPAGAEKTAYEWLAMQPIIVHQVGGWR